MFFLKKRVRKTHQEEVSSKYKCILGEKSQIYPEARIDNYGEDIATIVIGKNTHIRGRLLTYPSGGNITLGDYCYVGENTNIWSAINIKIGNNVLIAHGVDIFDHDTHPLDPKERHIHYEQIITVGHPKEKVNWSEKQVIIKDDAWIGCKSIILKGVTIGEAAVIAAGSVVTKDVEPYTVVAGNPAKVVKQINR